ncbi:MAG: GNAT family N-acetyltransferase [Desulfobacteraceae bacterium]|nr:GNAT family N-acetyltransferase [Desulfobacteraceae bacterium]MBC2756536.1 GNAT family N-acetyltransferase [Desulfobacteraceae bacterium]
MKDFTIIEAENKEDIHNAYQIRKEVFINEQKLFSETDIDENDIHACCLLALHEEAPVGTVRIFSNGKNGNWMGGRLAVKKKYRGFAVGEQLVKKAVSLAREKGATYFSANIQKPNVPFFKKLNWKEESEPFSINGVLHVKMSVDLY